MNIDCQWIHNNLEAFFCERLTVEENSLALRHIESCETCRRAVDELRSVDPLIKQLFNNELMVARAPRRFRWSVPLGVAATGVAAIIAIVALRAPQQPVSPLQVSSLPSPAAVATTSPESPSIPKVSTITQDRTKPQPVAPDNTTAPAIRTSPPSKGGEIVNDKNDAAPGFLVTDPAGYSRTLNDYRGYTLIFSVWSGKQPETVSNMERLYQTFGPDTKLRILGVATQPQSKPKIATFPIVYNQGSTLLGAKEAEVLIVDKQGAVRGRGSLLGDPNAVISFIRSVLSKINP
jgi:hypothetical protein